MIIQLADFIKQRDKIALRNKMRLVKYIISKQILQFGFVDIEIVENIIDECKKRNHINSIYGIKRERTNKCHKY